MSDFPVKIKVYTTTYNNAAILPFIIDYWKLYAHSVVVYDNGSTDNTLGILKKHDGWIQIRHWDTQCKYDITALEKFKKECYKGTVTDKIDYVIVCDVDEVLVYGDLLMRKLMDAKYHKVGSFTSRYYDAIKSQFPSYGNVLLQNYKDLKFVKNNNRWGRVLLFDPNAEADAQTEEIDVMHTKMVGVGCYKLQQMEHVQRLKTPSALEYGNDIFSIISKFNLMSAIAINQGMLKQKVIAGISNGGYKDIDVDAKTSGQKPNNVIPRQIVWKETKVSYGLRPRERKNKTVVVIPIYKTILDVQEIASLKQCVNILGGKYDIVLVGPSDLYFDYYENIACFKFGTLKCNPEYFKNIQTYSMLCETWQFYDAFSEWEYMFLYQLDGWIFYDNVRKFQILGYDYIGSPWVANTFGCPNESVGNGGVSFRKIRTFTEICKALVPDDFKNKYAGYEDLFFCRYVKTKFPMDLPPVETAMLFSWDFGPQHWYGKTNGHLPMCAHAWAKQIGFWKDYIDYDTVVVNKTQYTELPESHKHHRPNAHKFKHHHVEQVGECASSEDIHIDENYEVKDAESIMLYDINSQTPTQEFAPQKPNMPQLDGDLKDIQDSVGDDVPRIEPLEKDASFTLVKEHDETVVYEHTNKQYDQPLVMPQVEVEDHQTCSVQEQQIQMQSNASEDIDRIIKANSSIARKNVQSIIPTQDDTKNIQGTSTTQGSSVTSSTKKNSKTLGYYNASSESECRIALCAIAKNENRYIREWVDYYRSLGIDQVFLYDNNELDGERFEDVIGDYMEEGYVEVIDVRGVQKGLIYEGGVNLQPKCYIDCYNQYGENFEWMCFFDIDEFLEIKSGGLLVDALKCGKYDKYDTVMVSWENYDDNGLIYYKKDLVRKLFTHKSKCKVHGLKSIVRTGGNIYKGHDGQLLTKQIHYFRLEGLRACYSDGQPIDISSEDWIVMSQSRHDCAPMVLAHYKTKSAQEYMERQYGRYWGTSPAVTSRAKDKKQCMKEYFMYNVWTPQKQAFFDNYKK